MNFNRHDTGVRVAVHLSLLLFAAILVLSIVMWRSATLASDTSTDPRVEARQITARLPKLRKLAFKHEVPLEIENAAQTKSLMRQQVHKRLTPAEIQDQREEGILLAMWPQDFDLEQVALSLNASQMLGFYVPEEHRMVLLQGEDAAFSQVVDANGKPLSFPYLKEMTLAHELTHALQDQNFDLGRIDLIKHDDDRQAAFQAIVEGDATLTGLMYTFKGLDAPQARTALSEFINLSRANRAMVSVPDTITMQYSFVYGAGTRFVALAFKRGGFSAVNELLRNPPVSSREILNPDLFLGHPAPPAKIQIHGYEKILAGWRLVDENTLGEMMMLATVHQTLGDAENWLPMGNAWRADKVIMVGNGNARAIIGFIVFGDRANASHFAATYSHILDLVHHDRVPHLVQARDKTVIVLIGETAARAPALTPALWKETNFAAATPTARANR